MTCSQSHKVTPGNVQIDTGKSSWEDLDETQLKPSDSKGTKASESNWRQSPPTSKLTGSKSSPAVKPSTAADRPLVLYAYFETPSARENLEFFIAHGLHAAADFVFILNGD